MNHLEPACKVVELGFSQVIRETYADLGIRAYLQACFRYLAYFLCVRVNWALAEQCIRLSTSGKPNLDQ